MISDRGRSGGEGAIRGVCGRQSLGVDKIDILLQTSIGVLRIEAASLGPPCISILETRKASGVTACYLLPCRHGGGLAQRPASQQCNIVTL